MVTSEWEMLREEEAVRPPAAERFTSLQPTYEDSVAPDTDWEMKDFLD